LKDQKHRIIKYDLRKNALESLTHAIDHLTLGSEGGRESDIKRVILDISHAAELLIKEAIGEINVAFIWRNVDKYPSLEAQTVSPIEGLERFSKIANISISDDDKSAVRTCVRVRNAIQHYQIEISEPEAKLVIGRMLSFIFGFSKKYLHFDLKTEFQKDDSWLDLLEFYQFNQAYSEKIKTELELNEAIVQDCSSCGGMSFDIISEVCELCGHIEISEEYA